MITAADVPVFITYRDRYSMLERAVASLKARGFTNITVIDNDSAELLEEWNAAGVRVQWTDNAYRHTTPWALGLVPSDSYYIVMDCDIELDCPDDVAEHLAGLLEAHPEIHKIGLGIRTDDLPDPAPDRYAYSFEAERKVAEQPLLEFDLRDAPIDTHFAMYRPGSTDWGGITGARTEAPYLCRHLPWYNAEFSPEECLYYERTGHEWARTHSASELVPVTTFVPFTALRWETVVALIGAGASFTVRPMISDDSYWELLNERWVEGDTFVVVEQDIVIERDTIEELTECDNDWCASPYRYRGHDDSFGLGCTKFGYRLIERHPDLFATVAKMSDDRHPPKHWCRLDMWTYRVLTARGEKRCEHRRPVGHIDGDRSAHGCAE